MRVPIMERRDVELGTFGVPLMTPTEAVIAWIATVLAPCAVGMGILAVAWENLALGATAFCVLLISYMLLSVSRLFR